MAATSRVDVQVYFPDPSVGGVYVPTQKSDLVSPLSVTNSTVIVSAVTVALV